MNKIQAIVKLEKIQLENCEYCKRNGFTCPSDLDKDKHCETKDAYDYAIKAIKEFEPAFYYECEKCGHKSTRCSVVGNIRECEECGGKVKYEEYEEECGNCANRNESNWCCVFETRVSSSCKGCDFFGVKF